MWRGWGGVRRGLIAPGCCNTHTHMYTHAIHLFQQHPNTPPTHTQALQEGGGLGALRWMHFNALMLEVHARLHALDTARWGAGEEGGQVGGNGGGGVWGGGAAARAGVRGGGVWGFWFRHSGMGEG